MIRPDHRKAVLVECALPAALEAVGERWSFLILRGAFNGLAHFEEFQSTLGIAAQHPLQPARRGWSSTASCGASPIRPTAARSPIG